MTDMSGQPNQTLAYIFKNGSQKLKDEILLHLLSEAMLCLRNTSRETINIIYSRQSDFIKKQEDDKELVDYMVTTCMADYFFIEIPVAANDPSSSYSAPDWKQFLARPNLKFNSSAMEKIRNDLSRGQKIKPYQFVEYQDSKIPSKPDISKSASPSIPEMLIVKLSEAIPKIISENKTSDSRYVKRVELVNFLLSCIYGKIQNQSGEEIEKLIQEWFIESGEDRDVKYRLNSSALKNFLKNNGYKVSDKTTSNAFEDLQEKLELVINGVRRAPK